jgi:hypothetical protein
MRASIIFSSGRLGILPAFKAEQRGSVAMTTLKASASHTASVATRHLDVRLQKIRSLKTSALKPMKIVAAAKAPNPKPSIRSIVPYGLVVASLVLSGVTASEAHAAAAHKPAHVVTHAVPAQQIDPMAQFFQGLFGAPPVVRTARGRSNAEEYVPYDSPTYDTSPPVSSSNDAQAASDAEVQAIQQLDDENALNASMQAAEEQNDEANAATLQTEINAGM